mgnify:CR=1 FL=1
MWSLLAPIAIAQDMVKLSIDESMFHTDGQSAIELVFEGTVTEHLPTEGWLLSNRNASMVEYCAYRVQVTRIAIGAIRSGYVDLWESCDIRSDRAVGMDLWVAGTRFRGGASGLPDGQGLEHLYPPADDAIVPANFATVLTKQEAGWRYTGFFLPAGDACLSEGTLRSYCHGQQPLQVGDLEALLAPLAAPADIGGARSGDAGP